MRENMAIVLPTTSDRTGEAAKCREPCERDRKRFAQCRVEDAPMVVSQKLFVKKCRHVGVASFCCYNSKSVPQ